METFADAVEQLTSAQAGGFDFEATQAEKLIHEGINRLAARSQWIRAIMELGTTVADQANYELPERIVRLYAVMINNIQYGRRDVKTLWDLRSGKVELPYGSEGGVFVESYAEDGKSRKLELFATPDVELAGETINGFAAITPEPLASGDELPFPTQYRRAVVNFAKSIASADIDVDKATANEWREEAEGDAEALRLLANARSGSGPWRIPVAGHRRR